MIQTAQFVSKMHVYSSTGTTLYLAEDLGNDFEVMTASILTILYGFIFIIIQLQDLALLFGSLGVFLVLATTMYFSRKIDWFDVKEALPKEIIPLEKE